jgi:hypothetical protein
VALIAIKNEQLVTTNCTGLYILDKVLQLGNTKLIYYLAVLADAYPLIWGVVVPGLVVVLCFEDEEG